MPKCAGLGFHFDFVFLLLNLLEYEWVRTGKQVLSVADLKTAYFNRNWLQAVFYNLESDIDQHPNYQFLNN